MIVTKNNRQANLQTHGLAEYPSCPPGPVTWPSLLYATLLSLSFCLLPERKSTSKPTLDLGIGVWLPAYAYVVVTSLRSLAHYLQAVARAALP